MKNICFFINDITNTGGTERVSIMIANMLEDTGLFRVFFLSLHEHDSDTYFHLSKTIKHAQLFEENVHGLSSFPGICCRLRKALKANRADVIIDVDGILDLYALSAKLFDSIKVISWEHFNFHQNPTVPYRKISRRWAGIAADAIVTLTDADKQMYENGLKVLRCPVVSIPNPLVCEYNKSDTRGKKIILSAGRLTEQKGFDLLIQVAKEVLPKHPDWKWIILGEGEDRARLENLIEFDGLTGQMSLPGKVSNINDYYDEASLYVMTSRYEGLPMVLLEAKAHGLPIVSFDCETGPSEMILDGVNGFLVKDFNVSPMSVKVEKLISDSNLRKAFSEHALDGTQKFLPENVLHQWTELLSSI